MRGIALLVLLIAGAAPAAAVDADQARQILKGSWASILGIETWIFETDGEWRQFSGGIDRRATYSVEGMPANLFALESSSGRRYVVHLSQDHNSFQLFVEGSGDRVGSYSRIAD